MSVDGVGARTPQPVPPPPQLSSKELTLTVLAARKGLTQNSEVAAKAVETHTEALFDHYA
ncbi:MAG: hypothetical protein GXX79_19180 [Actinomycetales bacterium]|nr:hypothetical protein [Actinomycetales bacterium]